jgi:putative ABC transport system permease protein
MFFSRFIRTVQLGLKSLMLHKLRSGLTMLGIVFGVFSVIAMLAIGEGASAQAQQQVVALGATNIIVRSIKPVEESSSSGNAGSAFSMLRYGLLRTDFDRIIRTVPTIERAIPIREIEKEARYLHRTINARLVGCTAEYLDVNHLHVTAGRFLTDRDQETLDNVVVIAHDIATTLFSFEDPLGKRVQIGNIYYTVIGVTADRTASAAIGGSLSGQDFNKDLYIPIQTLKTRLGDQIYSFKSGAFSAEQVELNQITFKIQDREQIIPTAEVIRDTLQKYHGTKKDFAVIVPLELLRQADQLRQIFNIVLGSIAAISLVVGGIGIMNIMLATVTERTREIGIRRALGARQSDITQQFLTETIVLAGSGGLLGILLGLMTPYAFWVIKYITLNFILEGAGAGGGSEIYGIFTNMQPQIAVWSLPVAFGISVGVGIIFGLYPARAAARLDPIEALRHE